ncbi:hypothetical protein ACJIZ3_006078 [Penstemon smallii]|uniref:Cytochrome P450 n=1 Tax=Penstemon smallii TaxID=265156 RepID=A0ABD3S6U3_9LAMI
MDVDIWTFTILLSCFLISYMILKLIIGSSKTNNSNLNLPPGPRKLPLIGNLHLLAFSHTPHRILRDLATKYGPIILLQLGEISTIVVSSPETAKQVMKTHDLVFASRPSLLTPEIICYGNTAIAFTPYGAYWRQLRKLCTLELLSTKRVNTFRPIREEEFLNLCNQIASNVGSTINLTEMVGLTAYDITSRATLGKKTGEQAKFISMIREVIKYMGGMHIADVYPSIKMFRWISGLKIKLQKLHKITDGIIGNIIIEHKLHAKSITDHENKEHHEDLLDVLLKLQESGLELPLTTDNIKSVLVETFSAGNETSGTTFIWAMSEMLKNPKILENAQNEVRHVFDGKGYVEESGLDELKYIKAVVKEALRLHPPLPLLLPRESRERCKIDGYEIPAKTRVLVNAWAINRDPKYWKDAESFKPERFLDDNISVDYKGNDFKYIPFGAGRRICPGLAFGLANVELPIAMLLYHFDWILPNEMKPEDVDMTEAFGVTVRTKTDLYAIPVVTRPLPINSN